MVQYEESIDAYTPHDVEMVKKPGETFGFHLWFDDQGSSQKFKILQYQNLIIVALNSGFRLEIFLVFEIKSKFLHMNPIYSRGPYFVYHYFVTAPLFYDFRTSGLKTLLPVSK